MKKIILSLIVSALTMVSGAYAQNMGIGLRTGDPTGITFKTYFNANALEINLGRTKWGYRNGWYDNRFNDWYKNKNFSYTDFDYQGVRRASTPIALQVHYLFQNDIAEVDGLQWYYGFGGQFAHQSYRFDYRYKVSGDNDWIYVTGERVTDIDIGADGVLGLEYTFDDIPISLFVDATLFVEVIDNPFIFWGQGGLGARYNF